MQIPDFTEATFWTRFLGAVIVFVTLSAAAAGGLVFAMMMVLFSADGKSASEVDDTLFNRVAIVVVASVAIAVVVPPVMLLCQASAVHSAIPAGLGFIAAGVATMWYVVQNLGGQS